MRTWSWVGKSTGYAYLVIFLNLPFLSSAELIYPLTETANMKIPIYLQSGWCTNEV